MPIPLPQDDYKVNLEVFEGPLDLLLYLIKKDELDIYNIPIERITSQYMEYLNTMEMLDLNIASEFIVMASTLALIKSRMLLPVEVHEGDMLPDDDEGTDPRWDLVKQLVEYKRFKDAASRLQEREFMQQNIFGAGGDALVGEGIEDAEAKPLGDVSLFDLISAFNDVLSKAPVDTFGEIEPIMWSVPDKIDMILRLMQREKNVAFSKLFHRHSPRGEIIVTFLALLELLRLRQVAVCQSDNFSEIMVMEISAEALEPLPPPVIGGTDHAQ
jgi:segregation and condensation protein A